MNQLNRLIFKTLFIMVLSLSSIIATAQPSAELLLTPHTDHATPTRPDVLGQNMTGIAWHGIRGKQPGFYNLKLQAVDPGWMKLINAFPMHLLRMHWGNAYIWENSIGPVTQRKSIKHDHWNVWYNPTPGMDEFLRFTESMKNPPKLSLIASPFRPVQELADLVAYCNATTGKMAQLRAANGHPAPYNVKLWEMGNETDWRKRKDVDVMRKDTAKEKRDKFLVNEYIAAVKPRIAAMKAIDPSIKIYVHAKTSPWFDNDTDWPQWHQVLLKEMGEQFDGIVIHPYYDGNTVPICLKSVDQVIDDIKQYGPKDHPITVWVNEHARWVNYRKLEERPQSWSLQGAISTADFLIDLMKRPEVGMANYWCYGHSGPWRVVNSTDDPGHTQKFPTAIHGMFCIFNAALLPIATPIKVDEQNVTSHPKHYTYNVSAMLFTDPKTNAVSLLTVNRNAMDSFDTRIALPKLPSQQARQWLLTADALTSTNVPATPDATVVTQQDVDTSQTNDGTVALTIPAKSVTLWQWQ